MLDGWLHSVGTINTKVPEEALGLLYVGWHDFFTSFVNYCDINLLSSNVPLYTVPSNVILLQIDRIASPFLALS